MKLKRKAESGHKAQESFTYNCYVRPKERETKSLMNKNQYRRDDKHSIHPIDMPTCRNGEEERFETN